MYPIYHTEDRNIPFITEVTGTVTILEGSPEDIADHGIDILSMSVVSRYEKVGFDFGNSKCILSTKNLIMIIIIVPNLLKIFVKILVRLLCGAFMIK